MKKKDGKKSDIGDNRTSSGSTAMHQPVEQQPQRVDIGAKK